MKHKSDLKHTSTAKARAKDREKEAREGLRVAKDELGEVKEELQATKEELCTKSATLDWAYIEASEAKSSMERLIEKCNALHEDFRRQEALVSQRDGVIVELRDKACTLWAFRWLAFQRRAAKVFPSLDFNFQVPNEEEEEESVSKDKTDGGVYSDTPSSVPLPSEPEVPAEAGSSLSPAKASPSDLQQLRGSHNCGCS